MDASFLLDELLLCVFSYLGESHLVWCRRVCQRWARLLNAPGPWLASFGFDVTETFALLATDSEDGLLAAKWLVSTFGADAVVAGTYDDNVSLGGATYALWGACGKGHLAFAHWIVSAFGLLASDVRSANNAVFVNACAGGNLELVQWIVARFGYSANGQFDDEGVPTSGYAAFLNACAGGHLGVARWVVAELGLSAECVHFDNNNAFTCACEEGHLEVARWIEIEFGIRVGADQDDYDVDYSAEFHDLGSSALEGMCRKGTIEGIKWLIDTFVRYRCDLRGEAPNMLRFACEEGRIDLIRWLATKFELSEADVIGSFNDENCCLSGAMQNVCGRGSLNVLKCLVEQFGPFSQKACSWALQSACTDDGLDCAKWLVQEFELTSHEWGPGPLMCACDTGDLTVIEWLVAESEYGLTPADIEDALVYCADHYHLSAARLLESLR
jgi:F-box associated protein